MNEKLKPWLEKAKSLLHLITDKKTIKGVRITSQVVWNLFLLVLVIAILGGSFAAGVGAGYFASLVKDEPVRSYDSMKKDIYNYSETSELYFANDVYLGKLRTDLEREEVKLGQVSDYLINAVVATEDEYFYQHNGVVPKAVFRALFQEVTNSSIQSGGSTLTQQLIKNQILTNEVSFQRKANEILLALRLEKFFDKKEILEAYLNVSTFGRNSSGRNIAGVQAAAKGIFGKTANELTLPQAAFIAGLPQSPFGYTPFTAKGTIKNNLEPGLTRMKTVLKRMYDGGYISQKEYAEASAYDITKDFIPPSTSNPLEDYPWLTFEIESRAKEALTTVLAKKDGYTEDDLKKDENLAYKYKTLASHDLKQNGYKIYTTIDKDIYDAMQVAKDNYKYYGPDKPQEKKDPETGEMVTVTEQVQVGAMLIENKTGKIISFVGGREYDSEHQLNHATSAIRQNGSTMKPLLVYGPAIELGKASPGMPLPDVALKLDPSKDTPWPHNYDLKYSGIVSARYALAKSYNVPAVKLYTEILDQNPAKYLEKMGFSSLTKGDHEHAAASIGSLDNGVTIEENTNAFSTFANGGKFIDAYLIDKIVDKDGKVVYQHEVKPVDVFKPQTAWLTLDMMRDVINSGTAAGVKSQLKFSSDWAGKTGTGFEYWDSWLVATNPNVTFGIWTGYDTPKSLQTSGMSYSQRTNTLWAQLINAAYEKRPDLIAPKEEFTMPEGIVQRSFCAVSGLLPSEACSKAGLVETDYFNAKDVPTKVDDSLIEGKYVTINGKKYLALDATPSEFSQSGVILNPDFVNRMTGGNFKDIKQLIPNRERWGNVLVADAKMSDNGKRPDSVNLTVSGNAISWSAPADNDVIGYRVYQGGFSASKVASIKSDGNLMYSASPGFYYVTAVDIAGNESAPSNFVEVGAALGGQPEEAAPQ